jgi:hypothetical protein
MLRRTTAYLCGGALPELQPHEHACEKAASSLAILLHAA